MGEHDVEPLPEYYSPERRDRIRKVANLAGAVLMLGVAILFFWSIGSADG